MNKQNAQSGFTLIELVVVIVILGILAATALPKFVSLKSDAGKAAAQGVAAALSSAGATNYAQKSVGTGGSGVTDCGDVAALLLGGALPTGYSITAAAVTLGAVHTSCVVGSADGTANFTAIGT